MATPVNIVDSAAAAQNPWDIIRTIDPNAQGPTYLPKWLSDLNQQQTAFGVLPDQWILPNTSGITGVYGATQYNSAQQPQYVYSANQVRDSEGNRTYTDPDTWTRMAWSPLMQQAQGGQWSILNGQPYDVLDASGNVIGQQTLQGLRDEDNFDRNLAILGSLALGGAAFAGAGAAGAAGAGAGEAGAAGAAGAGTAGAGASFSPGVWGAGAIPAGSGYGLSAVTPGLAAGSTYGGAAIGGGLAGSLAAGEAAGGGSLAGQFSPSGNYFDPTGWGGGVPEGGGYGLSATTPGLAPTSTYGGEAIGAGLGAAPAASGGGWTDYLKTLGSKMSTGSGAFNWTDLIGPATQLVGGAMNANAAGKASDAQLQAAREAMALNEPFRQGGISGMNRLLDLLGVSGNTGAAGYGSAAKDFSMADFQADPGYAFRQSEGERALQRAASASGLLGSGKYLKDSMKFNQDLASTEYGNAFNRFQTQRASKLNPLQSLMGAGQTAANTVGEYRTQAGNAQAAGTVGQSNAWTNALGQGYSMYANQQQQNQNNALMNRLLGSRGY